VNYDEIRIELSAAPAAGNGRRPRGGRRYQTRVSIGGGGGSTLDSYVPPAVSATDIYNEWFASFKRKLTPASSQARLERRRQAGAALFQAVLASSVARVEKMLVALDQQAAAGMERGLRLRIEIGEAHGAGATDVTSLLAASSAPFEIMVPPKSGRFLARNRRVSIVRTLGAPEPTHPMGVIGRLRVLVAVPQPDGAQALGWEGEVARIRQALAARTDATVEVIDHASFDKVRARLRDGFHIFHFIGHGGLDRASGQWCLEFERDGASQWVGAHDLAERLGDYPMLRLVVLNACHSGELGGAGGADALAGIAAGLSVMGVPAVVAMQIAVTDSAAVDFASALYLALGQQECVEVAVADGRAAIPVDSPEWATPVFYLRGQSSDLFEFQKPAEGAAAPPDLKLGIRTLVESAQFPHLSDWAKQLPATTDLLLRLEDNFNGRFIRRQDLWRTRVLPRLNLFLAAAASQDRPITLQLAAHCSVAFAAGYYFHSKPGVPLTLMQVTAGDPLYWSQDVGNCPAGALWQDPAVQTIDRRCADLAIAVEISQGASTAVADYLAASGAKIGSLVVARIAGGPGHTRIESGAHAYQLAWQLHQWLMGHTGNRARRRLHFFIAAPNGFTFFLGQLALSLGKLRLYEYDFEASGRGGRGSYAPAIDLPQAILQ
jgi:hypothetical protein